MRPPGLQQAVLTWKSKRKGARDEVRHAAKVLNRQELTRQLLAFVLTAVLVWHTVVIPANPHARRARRPSRGGEERGARARRAELQKSRSGAESVDDLDWPEFIGMD